MELSDLLVKKFTEATKDSQPATARKETYATVSDEGVVVFDGAGRSTPCSSTVKVNVGDRVLVQIVNHQAIITGNLTSEAYDKTATENLIGKTLDDGEYVTVGYLVAGYVKTETLEANYITANQIAATYATITSLNAEVARINTLNANVANVNTLLAGNAGTGTLQAVHLTSANTVIQDALITNAMIASLAASKLTAGTINTSIVKIASSDQNENLSIDGSTIQINDGARVRVQIGKDGSNDYSIYIWDASGNLLWQPTGITGKGIGSGTIKDVNVANDAAIDGTKLNITSVAQALNNDGSITVDSSRVTIDNTTLSAAYTALTTKVDGNTRATETLETALSVVQGDISAKIWESDISVAEAELNKKISTLNDRYSLLELTVDGINSKVGEVETYTISEEDVQDSTDGGLLDSTGEAIRSQNNVSASDATKNVLSRITTAETAITQTKDEIKLLATKTEVNNLTSRVTSAESNITINANAIASKVSQSDFNSLSGKVTTAESNITQNANDILLKVDQKDFDISENEIGQKILALHDRYAALEVSIDGLRSKVTEVESYSIIEDGLLDSFGNSVLDSSGNDIQSYGATSKSIGSAIIQNANEIATKVSQTDFNALGNRVSTAESTITQHANAIASKVSQTDFNALGNRVSTAESSITQLSDSITSKVSKGDIASTINQTAQSVKIQASKIQFEGLVTTGGHFYIDAEGYVGSLYALGDVFFGIQNRGNTHGLWIGEYDSEDTSSIRVYMASGGVCVAAPNTSTDDSRLGTNSEPFTHVRSNHFDTISDKKKKNHVAYLVSDKAESVADEISEKLIYGLCASMYTMKDDGSSSKPLHLGFYAQDVNDLLMELYPNLNLGIVSAAKNGEERELTSQEAAKIPDSELSWTLSYDELIAPLVAVVQKQKKEIDELSARLEAVGA